MADYSALMDLEKKPANQQTGKLVNQQAVKPVKQKAGKPESQKAGLPAKTFVKPANQQTGKRALFQKVTYHLCPEAVDAIEDAKRLLKRRYGRKTTLEEIAEVSILTTYEDLLKNQQASKLVNHLSRNPESQ